MLIGKEYKIESDSLNVTLSKKNKSKNTKEVYWVPVAYLSSKKNALKYLVDLKVRETDLADLKTVVKRQGELHRLIDGLKL